MKPFSADDDRPHHFDPELLAGYVDGELDERTRVAVADWLRRNPEAAADVEGQAALSPLLNQTTPAEPDAAAWSTVFARIEQRLPPVRPVRFAVKVRWVQMGLSTAAAVLLIVSAWSYKWTTPREFETRIAVKPATVAEQPWQVASANDVEIISIDGRDQDSLVVGQPPVHEPLVLAAPDDVWLEQVDANTDGRYPSMPVIEDVATPLLVAPHRK